MREVHVGNGNELLAAVVPAAHHGAGMQIHRREHDGSAKLDLGAVQKRHAGRVVPGSRQIVVTMNAGTRIGAAGAGNRLLIKHEAAGLN